jgi:hypothetical protein
MLFPGPDNVDRVWGQVARSIAHGPLRDAGVYTAKVAPTSTGGEEQRSYLICIYFNDVYDEALVRKVSRVKKRLHLTLTGEIMTILLTEHGLESNSVKSNLYTLLGIDSNHPSKLRSTIWRPNEVIPVDEIKSLKEQYSSAKEAASNKAAASAPAPVSAPEPAAKSDEAGVGASAGKGAAGEPKVKRKEPADSTNTHKEEDKPMKRVKSAA